MKNFDTWSIPAHRQIDFETPSQVLGIEGVLISSSTIYTLAFRTRQLSYRVPKYISPDPHPALSVGDSVSIAFPPQRMVSGRIDGYALSGASFLRMASATFGFIAERTAAPPQSDEMTIRPSGRIRPSSDALITDLRRFRTPMGSFSGFTALTQVVYHGPCFFRIFSLRKAVQSAAEAFFGASRIPAQFPPWTLCEMPGRLLTMGRAVWICRML